MLEKEKINKHNKIWQKINRIILIQVNLIVFLLVLIWFYYIIDYYQNNYSDPISLTTLANNIHASKQTLISKFRKELGITPNAFLIKVRLNQSKQLLTHSNMSVGEISSSCGFENMYYFSNTFKKHFGISPSNYRNKFVL